MAMRAQVTLPADVVDRLDAAMSRALDGEHDAGLATAVREVMHAAYGSPNLRHDTDVAEAALAELRERDAGAVGATTERSGRRICQPDELLALARLLEAIGTAAHADTLDTPAVHGVGRLLRRVADDLAELDGGGAR